MRQLDPKRETIRLLLKLNEIKLSEVAHEAGVSVKMVSCVLNNQRTSANVIKVAIQLIRERIEQGNFATRLINLDIVETLD